MACAVIDVPLGLRLEFPGYEPRHFDLSAAPCPALVRELAAALIERTSTGGPVKSSVTAEAYGSAIRHFARHLVLRGFDAPVAALTEALVFDYWRQASARYESATRILLAHIEERHPGSLEPALVRQLDGLALNHQRAWRPRTPYSAGESERLIAACRATAEASEFRLAAAEALVATGHRPTACDWSDQANVAWALDNWGPLTSHQLGQRLGLEAWRVDKVLRGTLLRLHEALFPTMDAVLAFRLLVGLETGICPEGIDGMVADCMEWVGEGEARIHWHKARGAGAESHVFASRGQWSAGRLIERWLALSARARRLASDQAPLWLFCDGAHHRLRRTSFWWDARDAFVARHGLLDDDGRPLRLGFGTLRATYFARHDRHWNGALRIDPNHSARVEGDHYLAQARASDPLDATIEAAQRDALRKAAVAPLTLLDVDELAALVDDREAAATRLGITVRAAAQLLAGDRDVFAAACKDFYHSPHGSPGAPCPSPVWTCLFCPLAVFTPSKVANLLRLRDHLEAQWKVLGAEEWMHLYGAAQVRLERDILPRFSESTLAAARSSISASDDPGPYLRPEEAPWHT
jgi:hypothetical protein